MADITDVLASLLGGGLSGFPSNSGGSPIGLPSLPAGGQSPVGLPSLPSGGGSPIGLPTLPGFGLGSPIGLPVANDKAMTMVGRVATALAAERATQQPGAQAGQLANRVAARDNPAVANISLSGLGPGQRAEFLQRAMRLGLQLEAETGIPAQVFAAMAANESNFGNAAGNIMGGVKASPNDPNAVWHDTWEMVNGQRVQRREPFVASATPLEGMRRVAETLQSGRYAPAYQQLRAGAIDADEFLRRVNAAGYATNPNWAQGEIVPLMREAAAARDVAQQLNAAVNAEISANAIEQRGNTDNPAGQAFLANAMRLQGVPYVWGGTSAAGVDCSGLIIVAARESGHPLQGRPTAQGIYNQVQRVDASAVQPGDLVFFEGTSGANAGERISHVGIVTQQGLMLNAPEPGKTVTIAPYTSPFWAPKIVGFGRLP